MKEGRKEQRMGERKQGIKEGRKEVINASRKGRDEEWKNGSKNGRTGGK